MIYFLNIFLDLCKKEKRSAASATDRFLYNLKIQEFNQSSYIHKCLRLLRPFGLYEAPPPKCIYDKCCHCILLFRCFLLLRWQMYGLNFKMQIFSRFFLTFFRRGNDSLSRLCMELPGKMLICIPFRMCFFLIGCRHT